MGIQYYYNDWEEFVSSLDFTTQKVSSIAQTLIRFFDATLNDPKAENKRMREIYTNFLNYVFSKDETGEVLKYNGPILNIHSFSFSSEDLLKNSLLEKMKGFLINSKGPANRGPIEYIMAILDDFVRWNERESNGCAFNYTALNSIDDIDISRAENYYSFFEPYGKNNDFLDHTMRWG
jgi:hypothetical protein